MADFKDAEVTNLISVGVINTLKETEDLVLKYYEYIFIEIYLIGLRTYPSLFILMLT